MLLYQISLQSLVDRGRSRYRFSVERYVNFKPTFLYSLTFIGERLLLKNIQPKTKPTRHSQMFWGVFCFGNRTALYPIIGDPESARGGVSSRTVLSCLQENLPTICEPGSVFL